MSEDRSAARAPKRILTATDFSESAETGISWAKYLARKHEAVLHLIHVVEAMPISAGLMPLPPEAFDAFSEAGRERLRNLASDWRDEGLQVETRVAVGRPAEEIVRAAGDAGTDLVVLATRGRTGLANLLLGGTASEVVRRSSAPVLTVHPGLPVPVAPPATIVAPVDFSRHGLEAARRALSIFGFVEGARIVLLHAWHFHLDYEIYGMYSAERSARDRAEAEREIDRRLERLAAELHREGLRVEPKLVAGYPAATILEEARIEDADLVALGTQGTRGLERLVLGSVADRVVQRAPCPVLTARYGEGMSEGG